MYVLGTLGPKLMYVLISTVIWKTKLFPGSPACWKNWKNWKKRAFKKSGWKNWKKDTKFQVGAGKTGNV